MFRYKNLVLLVSLSISLLTLLNYIPALNSDFISWDDHLYVYENSKITSIDLGFFKSIFFTEMASNWHPLTMLSLAIDYSIWELNPYGYHLTNIIIHSLNTLLVSLISIFFINYCIKNDQSETMRTDKDPQKKSIFIGSVTALLFGLHPSHVESVAWVSERKDLLCAFFFLLSLFLYFKYQTSNKKKKLYYSLSILTFILSALSKPMAVTLPLILFLLDFFPLNRLKRTNIKVLILEKIPFIIISIMLSILTLWAQSAGGALSSTTKYPFEGRILVAAKAFIYYIAKLLLPTNLAPFYSYPSKISLFTFETFSSVTLLVLTLTFLIYFNKKYKFIILCIAYYIITLLPVVGIVHVGNQMYADRYTYLPSLSIFILMGTFLNYILNNYSNRLLKYFIYLLTFIMVTNFTILTSVHIKYWKNSIKFWTHQINVYPDTYYAYINRGNAYQKSSKLQLNLSDLNMAIKIDPYNEDAYMSRGELYSKLKEYNKAINDYSRALTINKNLFEAYNNRGNAYIKLKHYKLAITDFSKILNDNNSNALAYSNRGISYTYLNKWQLALHDFNTAIKIENNNHSFFYNRGMLHEKMNTTKLALNDYNRSIELNRNNSKVYFKRANFYESIGMSDKALLDFSMTIEIDSNYEDAYINRGIIYNNNGNYEKAIGDFTKVIKLNKNSFNAFNNRAISYILSNNAKKALEDFKKAYSIDSSNKSVLKNMSKIYTQMENAELAKFYKDKLSKNKLK